MNSLPIAGSSNAWLARLDLNGNDLAIHAGDLKQITNQAAFGYSNALWTGLGITSTSAAVSSTHLTAIGVVQNNQSGTPLYTASNPFDGTTPAPGDVLLKYTCYRDANLDGKIDGTDYARIDNGSLNHLTGWFNGNFNYDSIVNGSDYTLIDNAYNSQGASLAVQVAESALSKARAARRRTSFSQSPIEAQNSTDDLAASAAGFCDAYFAGESGLVPCDKRRVVSAILQ